MAETPLNKDQLPPLALDDLTSVTADGKDAFIAAQGSGLASATNRLATINDVIALADGGVFSQTGLFGNNGFACGLDCWENESPFPLASYPLTEMEKVRVIQAFAGPKGTDLACGCPGLGIEIVKGYEGCGFDVVAQTRDFKCKDLLICDNEFTLQLTAYVISQSSTLGVTPTAKVQFFNEGVYLGEQTFDLTQTPITSGVGAVPTKIDSLVNITADCCADEVRVVLGITTDETVTYDQDVQIFVQSFQMIGRLGAVFGPLPRELYDSPTINLITPEGLVHYDLAASQQTVILERAEEAPGWSWDSGGKIAGNWDATDIQSNKIKKTALREIGCGVEVQVTDRSQPGWADEGLQFAIIDSPTHLLDQTSGGVGLTVDYRLALNPKAEAAAVDVEIFYRRNAATVDDAWTSNGTQAIPASGSGSFVVDLSTLVGGPDGTWEFVIFVDDGDAGFWSNVVMIGYNVGVPTDFDERPVRFVNTADPICTGSYGLRIRRSLDRFTNTAFRPFVDYFDLSQNNTATHIRLTLECSINENDTSYPLGQFNPLASGYGADLTTGPIVMMTDANGSSRVLGKIRTAAGPDLDANSHTMQDCVVEYDDGLGSNSIIIPIAWLTGQQVATTNANALIPFDYSRVASLEIISLSSQMLVRSLTLDMGVGDDLAGGFNTLILSQEVDLTDDYLEEDINDRWTQAGPAAFLRNYDDTRLYWGELHLDDANFEDEFEYGQRMSLVSTRALNRMNTAFKGCPIDEMEVDANYIALHRTNNFEFDISSTNRDVFYSVIRRVFDDEGYVDISSVCTVDDGTKRRLLFPDIQFNAAVPNGHWYQFQGTLVDDRGNKLVGSWSPVLSPRNTGVTLRTERWADTDEFGYVNGSFSIDSDALYAAQLEDFNFTRVSEMIVRVLGMRPQDFNSTSIWETYSAVGYPGPVQAVAFSPAGYQVAMVPVGWHEGQLVVNVHVYPYDEIAVGLGSLDDVTLQFELGQGFVTDRLLWGAWTISSETGFESGDYTIDISTGGHTNSDNAVMTLLIGGLNAAVRNGTESLFVKHTTSATTFIAEAEREFSFTFSGTELANVIDDPEFGKPCIALGNFCVQGPGGSLVLDDLTKYDLDTDPGGAIACFRRDWAELTESNTLAAYDHSVYTANDGLWTDEGVRVINYDGGLLVLMDESTDSSIPLNQWEVLAFETNAHPQMHKIAGTTVRSTGSGSLKPGWLNTHKFAPVVNFSWENTDPVTGAPVPHDSLAVLDLDWGVLAGRTRGWHLGSTAAERQTIWITKRELTEVGVFLIDENFDDLPDDTVITLSRAGFFFEGFSNQIHNLDFDNFVATLFGADPPNDPGIGDDRIDDETVGAGTDAAILATFSVTDSTDFTTSVISQAAAEARMVPLFNRGLRLTGPTSGSRLGKNNVITYTPGSGLLNVTSTEMVAGIGFINPLGVDLSALATVSFTVAGGTYPTAVFAFGVLRTNYGRQLLTEQQTVPAAGTITFSTFTAADSDLYTYEPSAWEVGRVFRDSGTEPAFSTEFQDNWDQVGIERVTAVELYVVAPQRSADGTAIDFDITNVSATGGPVTFFDDGNLDSAFNGYDPETAGRAVLIDRSSDQNFCKVHQAAINARSNRSCMFLHYRPDRYGQANNDRLAPPTASDLSDLDTLAMDLRAFGPHYLMVVAIENDGTNWTVIDADSGGGRLVLQESPEIRDYARAALTGSDDFDHDDTTPLSFFKVSEALEATVITNPVEEYLIVVVPLHGFHGPSADIDDLALRDTTSALLFGETFDFRGPTDLLREWDAEFTPGIEKMSQTASVTHPHLWFDPFQQNLDGARRSYKDDYCGNFHPHNILDTGDSVDCCRLPLIFSTEPDQLKYYDDTNYDQGGRGGVLVPSKTGFEAVNEAAARTGEAFFHTAVERGVNNRILGYAYQKHTGCCLGVPIRSRDVEFTAPECACGGGPSGIVGITNFITHPKLCQAIVDDNFVTAGFPVGVERDLYGPSFCFSYKRDTTPPAYEWVDFDSSDTSPQRVFYAGGGRSDPAGPFPGDNLFVTVYLGPNSSAVASRQAFIATDAVLHNTREYTFDCGVHDVSGFAIGFPVWIRNSCSPDGCKYDMCDVRSSEDSNVAGVYGVVTDVDVPGSQITVEFNDPVEGEFIVSQFAEIVVSPEGAMGFYLEFSPDFLNEVTDPDPNATLVRWGFRHWETTEPLGDCGCGDGGGYVCDGDATSTFHELVGEDTDDPVHPRDFFGTFNPPAQHTLLNADALPGQNYIEICNPEKYEDHAPIAVVDNTWVNGFVARVVGRDVLQKRLYLDRTLPLASESLCGWDPTPFDGFLTSRAAIVYRAVDFLPVRTLSPSGFLDQRGIPQQGKVHFDQDNGKFTFHPNESAYDYWIRYYDSNNRIQLPKEGGVYRLIGVDACGRRTQASEWVTVFGSNRQQQFFEERGFKVTDGQIMPLDPPYPPVPDVPAAGAPFGADQFEGTTPMPGGATTVDYQTLFYDAPPVGPMAGDADLIDPQTPIAYKVGSGDISVGVTYDTRLYMVQETRHEFHAGVQRAFVDPGTPGTKYTISVGDTNIAQVIGNTDAGASLTFYDPGDGGPQFADCQIIAKGPGSTTITLTKSVGDANAPDVQTIAFFSRDPLVDYLLVAWADGTDPVTDGVLAEYNQNVPVDIRVGVAKIVRRDQSGGPGATDPPEVIEIMIPASDLAGFTVGFTDADVTWGGGTATLSSVDGTALLLNANITVGASTDNPGTSITLTGGPTLPFPFDLAGDLNGDLTSEPLGFTDLNGDIIVEVNSPTLGAWTPVAMAGSQAVGTISQTSVGPPSEHFGGLQLRLTNDAGATRNMTLDSVVFDAFSNVDNVIVSSDGAGTLDRFSSTFTPGQVEARYLDLETTAGLPAAFSLDVTINSDVAGETPYTITLTGTVAV